MELESRRISEQLSGLCPICMCMCIHVCISSPRDTLLGNTDSYMAHDARLVFLTFTECEFVFVTLTHLSYTIIVLLEALFFIESTVSLMIK